MGVDYTSSAAVDYSASAAAALLFAKGVGNLRKTTGKNSAPDESGGILGEFIGTIKSFSHTNGYGFIECPEIKEAYGYDIFLHHLQVGSFNIGDYVQFSAFLNSSGKPQAKEVKPPDAALLSQLAVQALAGAPMAKV